MATQSKALVRVDELKAILSNEKVRKQFENALSGSCDLFVASLIDVYSTDSYLQNCTPRSVAMEALKAATLRLPINKSLGFAWIVPYKDVATMQIGYKGYIQLAQRTGQYRYLNAGIIYEGMTVKRDLLTGEVEISGEKKKDKATHYFFYMELLNGFKKTICWTADEVTAHAKRYSPSFNSKKTSPWKTNFDDMALKTMVRQGLSKYGIMSVEMASAMQADRDDEASAQAEVNENMASEVIDITDPATDLGEPKSELKSEAATDELAEKETKPKENGKAKETQLPGFMNEK